MKRRRARDRDYPGLYLEAMEPRVLLSADPLGGDIALADEGDGASVPGTGEIEPDWIGEQLPHGDLGDEGPEAGGGPLEPIGPQSLPEQDAQLDEFGDTLQAMDLAAQAPFGFSADAQDGVSRELVFIDADTPDYEALIEGLDDGDPQREFLYVLLDGSRDGVEQITETLSQFQDLDAVHILSHGRDGAVQLGNATLDGDHLDSYADAIRGWGDALSEQADLLIYGCELAVDDTGRALVDRLAGLTGADVAASDDLTGSLARGGDWDLEYRTGSIETGVFLTETAAANWQGLLALPTADASAGAPYQISEGGTLSLDGSNSSDPDGDPLSYRWDVNGDGSFGEVAGPTPTLDWATLQGLGIDDDGGYTIGLEVDDGNGGTDTTTVGLTVDNTAPTLTASGAATAVQGQAYSLDLSATDPGADTITSYTVNWGDNTVSTEAYAGPVTSVTHTYTDPGFTRNITFSAQDEDGAWSSSELLVGNWILNDDKIFRFDASTGAPGTPLQPSGGELNRAYAAVVGPDGDIYVSGYQSNNIARYAPDGSYVGIFVDSQNFGGGIKLGRPDGLAWGPDGNLYVSNYHWDNILRFDPSGNFIDEFGAGGALNGPTGLAFGPDGDLYVASYINDRLVSFDGVSGGSPTTVISSGLGHPEQIAFDAAGNLYIANESTSEVAIWDGTSLSTYFSDPQLNVANGVSFGPDGQLYASSYNNDLILRFDGTSSEVFVSAGSGGLDRPTYLSFTPAHQVTINAAVNSPPTGSGSLTTTALDDDAGLTALFGALTVSDADPGESDLVLRITLGDPAAGTLSGGGFTDQGGGVYTAGGLTVAQANAALDTARFTPTADTGSTGSFSTAIGVAVDDGTAGFQTVLAPTTVTISRINDAPTLGGGPYALGITDEDTTSTGVQVSTILGGLTTTDAEGDVLGIAVTAAPGNGGWQYSTDSTDGSDGTWTVFGAVSSTSALLLSDTSWVRYAPDGVNPEALSLVFRAWDQSSGTASTLGAPSMADSGGGGGSSAYSAATAQADLTVTGINDPPTFGAFVGSVDTTSAGVEVEITLSDLLARGDESDVDGTVDAFVVKALSSGILRIGANAGSALPWFPVLNDVIDGAKQAYWFPMATGTVNAFEVVARDDGGAESSGNVMAQVEVVAAGNSAPTLSGGPYDLGTTDEDTTSTGVQVSTILGGLTTADVDFNTLGIAVTAAPGNGNWQYSVDSTDGSDGLWTDFGPVVANSALILSDTTWLRYDPDRAVGESLSLDFRAWDGTTDSASAYLSPATVNPGAGGGSTAYSTGSAQADLTVTPVNDAPVGLPLLGGSATEDQTLTADISGISDADGLGAFGYQWLRGASQISGATASSYTLGDADVGSQIAVQVDYIDGQGKAETLTSAQSAVVAGVNDVPVGLPMITGTVTEDQTLIADTSGISDADGLGGFNYQWLRDGLAIAGATGGSYTLGDADVDSRISVQVGYTDGQGTAETLISTQTARVTNVNDAPVGLPAITGPVQEDGVLVADTTGITDADGLRTFNYQWLRDGVAVTGATGGSYTLGDADVGGRISLRVSYTDVQGTAEGPLTSAQTVAVANVNDPPAGLPVITGSATEDQTLTVDGSGISDADGLGAFNYQWLRGGSPIAGATASSYTLGDADVGGQITVRVGYTDGQGRAESLVSTATSAVAGLNDAPTGLPVLVGSATEDQTLTADSSGIGDADGLGAFNYQWLRGGSPIAGATASSYTLGDADVGSQIAVRVGYTDGQGTVETLDSTPSAAVSNVNDAPILTGFAGPLATVDGDAEIALSFAQLMAGGDAADVDGSVVAFVVKSVSSGSLRIGLDADSAAPWTAATNDTIDGVRQAYWVPGPDAIGTVTAFAVVARDDAGAESATPVGVQLSGPQAGAIPPPPLPPAGPADGAVLAPLPVVAPVSVDADPEASESSADSELPGAPTPEIVSPVDEPVGAVADQDHFDGAVDLPLRPDSRAAASSSEVTGLSPRALLRAAAVLPPAGPALGPEIPAGVLGPEAFEVHEEFTQALDALRNDVLLDNRLEHTIVGSTIVMSTGLSVGYVVWMIRGGVLLSSVLSSLPAWHLIDPLPVLDRAGGNGFVDDGESLQSMIEDHERRPEGHEEQDRERETVP